MTQAHTLLASIGRAPRATACMVVQQFLYSVESGVRTLPDGLAWHRASCLACQTESVRQRQVLRGLHALGEITELVPSELAADLDPGLAASLAESADQLVGKRWPSRTAIASAASLAALGAVVLAGRRIRSIAS